ncbi:MAG: molybdopterin synthase sulfur carrier subunit [Actinomycetales bacterium]|nr:MAG: molybdopterin synthase sulfur carrier subunit [Actinomycetales bacterium]
MEIRYYAAARAAAGLTNETIDNPPETLGQLIDELAKIHPGKTASGTPFGEIIEICSFLADGTRIETDSALDGIKCLDVLPPFAGG